jgi:hypothetical protein
LGKKLNWPFAWGWGVLQMETTGACVATVEVNLIKISKRLQFGARVASAAQGWSCQAATLPFTAHNNGKDRYDAMRDRKLFIYYIYSFSCSVLGYIYGFIYIWSLISNYQ